MFDHVILRACVNTHLSLKQYWVAKDPEQILLEKFNKILIIHPVVNITKHWTKYQIDKNDTVEILKGKYSESSKKLPLRLIGNVRQIAFTKRILSV